MSVDQKTYELYEQGQWKALIKLGKSSLEKNIDFYYLQYRMGIAYYQLKNYRRAIPFFEKVLKQKPDDESALEYLYFSYLFSARTEDARILSLKFNPSFKKQLNISDIESIINGAGGEYKNYQFADYTIPENTDKDVKQKVRKNLNYFNANFTHHSRKKFSLFHAFSYLSGKNRVFDPNSETYEIDENVKQFQYYIAGNWHLGKGLNLKVAIHYIHTTHEGLNPGPNSGPGNQNRKYLFIEKQTSFVGFAKLSKNLSNFNFRASSSLSNLNGELQFLPLLGLDYYPLGNSILYLSTDVPYQFAPDAQNFSPGFILKQKIGIRVIKPLWFEPFIQYGKVNNFADEDAYVIYNNKDAIESWYGARLNLYIYKSNLSFYYIYQSYQNTNYYRIKDIPGEINYFSSTHLIGLKWKI